MERNMLEDSWVAELSERSPSTFTTSHPVTCLTRSSVAMWTPCSILMGFELLLISLILISSRWSGSSVPVSMLMCSMAWPERGHTMMYV